ncbi:porin [Paucibacter sp. XJ19-41]|uniref:porin n=1 Tax=Paucibacter sp. XJ19-41 TaxID=2927824 RepID=UPI00234A86BE|nr:porin [Paucibacter sp. XJ19-41]MDC6168631.1 porin [Paucibacter sp. XJ19-41]
MKKTVPTPAPRKTSRLAALLAVAMLGASGAALAQAEGSAVSIYGFLKVDAEIVSGGSNGSLKRLANNLSVLGFRAREDLGGGLSVWAQIETNVRADTGEGPWGGRNTGIGLKGSLGELVLGQWETPLRFVSIYAVDPFTAGIFASNRLIGNGFATAANGAAAASFDRRQPNLIQYWSPSIQGFSARLAWAPSEEKTDKTAPELFSGLLSYSQGPLYAAYGYELHREYFGPGSADSAHRFGIAYSFGPTRLRGSWERLRYEPAPGQQLSRNAWQLALTHQLSASGSLRASYVRAGRSSGNASTAIGGIARPGSDSGASQVSLGYGHTLSKRTELWAAYTRISNGADALYNLSANSLAGLQAGQDPQGLGLGITHRF